MGTRVLNPDNVGYNISYVDHVYLPVAIAPKNNLISDTPAQYSLSLALNTLGWFF
jgi:hypothetical protein